MLLEIFHETRYDYAAPVTLAHHLAHLQPLEDAHQQLLAFDLDIDPVPAQRRDSRDAMGNAQRHFSLLLPHARLHVRASSRVRVQARFAGLQPALSPAWDEVAQSLRYVARAPFRPEVEFAMPSPYVPRLGVLREFAAPSLPPGRPLAEAALELMHRIHTGFAYDSASTEIDTPLAQVVAQRRGVCQDFAHLMAGALRMWGLPARYVSGYLLTQAPEGGAQMLGADASHAWVQVWVGEAVGVAADGWLDLDPTNAMIPGETHVRLAIGRDYGDVAPLRGVILGGGRHALNVAVRTRVVEAAADAAPEAGPRLAIVHSQES